MSESTELFGKYYNEADKYMQKMTLEEKIAQMFFIRYNESTSQELIIQKKIGGFVLYGIDFKCEEKYIMDKIKQMQNLSMKSIDLPLGLAVDEEGGIVNRVSRYHREKGKFPSPQEIYKNSGIQGILDIEKEKISLLKKFNLNVNLAPVADMSYNSNDFIYSRTLGQKEEETSNYIGKVVDEGTAITLTVNKIQEIKQGTVNIHVKSLTGYKEPVAEPTNTTNTTADKNENKAENKTPAVTPKAVSVRVKVDEESVYNEKVLENTEVVNVTVKGKGTITVKVYIDEVLKDTRQMDLNSDNRVIDIK